MRRLIEQHPLPWTLDAEPLSLGERTAMGDRIYERVVEADRAIQEREDVSDEMKKYLCTEEGDRQIYRDITPEKVWTVRDANGKEVFHEEEFLDDLLVRMLVRGHWTYRVTEEDPEVGPYDAIQGAAIRTLDSFMRVLKMADRRLLPYFLRDKFNETLEKSVKSFIKRIDEYYDAQ